MLHRMTNTATKETTTMTDQMTAPIDRPATAPEATMPTGRPWRVWSPFRKTDRTGRPTAPDRLRFVPPVAALGTAFVMQTIAVTDTVGGAMSTALNRSPVGWVANHSWLGYVAALILGVAVASCAEGGAAYLLDLYDKHLLARDSVWVLRLAMCVYVAGSALAIHWWTAHRQLPTVTSWLLAGMSASALFLWSRGSRWRNRVAMRDAGQLDPALPKLPAAAKFWHPIRSLNTIRLVSWEPVATTDEARARYDEWSAARRSAKATRTVRPVDRKATTRAANRPTTPDRAATDQPTTAPTTPVADAPGRPSGRTLRVVGPTAAVANAAVLRGRYGDDLPTSMRQIRADLGWSKERVDRAVEAYQAGTDREIADDTEEATG